MKVLICTNILTVIDAAAYISHCNFWYRIGKTYPKDTFISMTPPRMSIDQARNWSARMALEMECDYLLFLDDDMIIHPDTLASLIDADQDIVMAHTYIRGVPFNVMSFIKKEDGGLHYFNDYKEHINKKGIVPCDAVGFAVCLIKMDLIRKMEAPYFVTGTHHTEDIYFCCKARREISEDVSIAVDTRVPTGHLLHKEFVHEGNVDKLKVFYDVAVEVKDTKEKEAVNGDRGTAYYDQIKQVLGQD